MVYFQTESFGTSPLCIACKKLFTCLNESSQFIQTIDIVNVSVY